MQHYSVTHHALVMNIIKTRLHTVQYLYTMLIPGP